MRARNVAFLGSFPLLGLSALALVMAGCGSSSSKPRGSVGAACYADNLCNAGLSCIGTICVPSDGGGLPVDAPASDAKPNDAHVAGDGAAGSDGAAAGDGAAGHDGGNATDGGGDAAAQGDAGADAAARGDAGAETGSSDTAPDDGGTDDAGAAG